MRYLVLAAAVVMQSCLGATYSWSVYVQPLKDLTGLDQGPVQVPFTVFYFVFPFTMMIAGQFLPRIGTRRSAMTGGVLFGSGWILASLGKTGFLFTILGIGCMAGIGAGMAYIVPIAVCIQWFPKAKGLVTGLAVAGFGGGAALVSQTGGYLTGVRGLSPFQTFMVFGIIFLVLVVTAGFFMKAPKADTRAKPPKPLKSGRVLSHANFRLLYAAMFVSLAAGFAVNANLKEMYQGNGNAMELGVTAVSLFALANAAGRIIWGAIFDRMTSASAIQANLVFQACVILAAPWLLNTGMGFWTMAFLTGFNYGGVLVLYVSSASRSFGTAHIGQVYGWLFTSNIPASVSPILAGLVFDRTGHFDTALFAMAGLLLAAAVMIRVQSQRINQKNCLAPGIVRRSGTPARPFRP